MLFIQTDIIVLLCVYWLPG